MNDLETYARMGRALFAAPGGHAEASARCLNALTAATLHPSHAHTQESEWVDRATTGLMDRSKRISVSSAFKNHLLQPFFRLQPEMRLILVGLHIGGWSYARLARILGAPGQLLAAQPEAELELQKLAWGARIQIATAIPDFVYPGAPIRQVDCPPYRVDAPWTQRFLDEEIPSGSERLELQSHLLSCSSCAQALAKCRALYYRVEEVIHATLDELESDSETSEKYSDQAQKLDQLLQVGPRSGYGRNQLRLWNGFQVLLRQPDVLLILLLSALLVGVWYFRR